MLRFKVSGMTCGDCARTVSRAVDNVPAVERTLVDLERGEVTVEGHPDPRLVRAAITDVGYTVEAELGAP